MEATHAGEFEGSFESSGEKEFRVKALHKKAVAGEAALASSLPSSKISAGISPDCIRPSSGRLTRSIFISQNGYCKGGVVTGKCRGDVD